MQSISIIIPIYNESPNIETLLNEIRSACEQQEYEHEIIVVDDGSIDDSIDVLRTIPGLTIIVLRKNFGQTAALDAGIKAANNDLLIMMDGDGQNDPADIPKLVKHLEENQLDVVSGWRKKRKDALSKRVISRIGFYLRSKLIQDGVKDSGCTLKIYRRECFTELSLYGEMHRFIPALLKIRGFKIGEIEVNHRPRTAGKSHYNWRRTIKASIDLLSVWFWNKYSTRPLHFLGTLGLVFIFLGALSGGMTFYNFLKGQGMSETAWPLLTVFFFLGGLQLFISGLLFDITIKNFHESNQVLHYQVRETIQT